MQAHLDKAYWLGLAISVLLPVLVGLVTTRVTNAGVKAVLLLLLSSATGLLTEVAHPGAGFDLGTAVLLAGVSFATGVLSHFGLWKPTGVAGKAADVGVTSSSPVQGV